MTYSALWGKRKHSKGWGVMGVAWWGRPLWKDNIWFTGMKTSPYNWIHCLTVIFFSFKIYFETVKEKYKEFPHSLHTDFSVVSILPHFFHYLLLLSPGISSFHPLFSGVYLPKTKTLLHFTIQYSQPGNQHWYNSITQSIDLIQMMPVIPAMSLFPFWSRILASTMYCLWLLGVILL